MFAETKHAFVAPSGPPPPVNGPLTITTGGTYTGTYQSTDPNTPVITISTTAPVTLSRMRIIAKGYGVWAYDTHQTRLTITDCTLEQTDPGGLFDHRAVRVNQPASFVYEHNIMTGSDGVLIHGLRTLQVDPLSVSYNMSINIGQYPRVPGGGNNVFVALDNVVAPAGQISWNHTQNLPGQSEMEDNISLFQSGGLDVAHRIDVGHNLIDGAYSRVPGSDAGYTGGGINLGDAGSSHSTAHDNVVVSTSNYGISVAFTDNYAHDNLCVNDGVEQVSDFGGAIVAWPECIPEEVHATNTSYNWRRSTTDPAQYHCYYSRYGTGAQVSTSEQQARDFWESSRAAAGVTVGPRP